MADKPESYDPIKELIKRDYDKMLKEGTIGRHDISVYKATMKELEAKKEHITESQESRIRFNAVQTIERGAVFDSGAERKVIDTISGYEDALTHGRRNLDELTRGAVADISRL